MAKLLNFNQYRPPVLPLELMDDKRTRLNLSPPTVDLQEELRARQSELRELLSQEDAEMVNALYDLAARLINCNRNLKRFTADELRTTYRMDVEDLVLFYRAYADFLLEIENAKN